MTSTLLVHTTATATVVKQIARTTSACQVHGLITGVNPREGRHVERGSYMAVMLYEVTFEDGSVSTYWMRGSQPKAINNSLRKGSVNV